LPGYRARVRTWTLEEAEADLPRVRDLVARIQSLLVQRRGRARIPAALPGVSPNGHGGRHGAAATLDAMDGDLREAVEELTSDGIVLRDPERGLIDFPARSPSGRDYLICWLLGEDEIGWWHWPDAGFAGRTPITEPPD
jgi:hypothetical protein